MNDSILLESAIYLTFYETFGTKSFSKQHFQEYIKWLKGEDNND